MDGLASEDLSPQKAALDALGRSKPDPARHDEVVEALKPLITDPDATIRASAAKAMSIWADSHDVPMLITALDDPDRNVRRAAMSGFARLQDERAAEPLARQLADSDILIHNDAVRVLRQMGPIAEPAVIKVLNSNSSDVRAKERACQVLQNIGTKDSIRALNKAAAAKTPVQRYAQAALKAITARQRAN
jgi:HEAT repeat protein